MRLVSVPTDPDWGMRSEIMSQGFTTRVDQLWTVSVNKHAKTIAVCRIPRGKSPA
ncbi:hypothetical protein DOZ80_02750 [Pseudomonas fluorescens]|uniref:DUF4113 domain-containing protein n=1 Tax=Pseudomonas fluorescens TaxID=294 RepID=A0A327NBB7_PSEFL|nr:hypothetical protein DOZ80_02750 [Pseudomonas fluorescens]